MARLVTIGIPVYKRLHYLPQTLKSVNSQDYPNIELVVSDNGMNGEKISEIIDKYYSRSYRFRQNPISVDIITHFNQIIEEAHGEYFVLLSDDDEISPNYISEQVNVLDNNPRVCIAFSKTEAIDEMGNVLRISDEKIPDIMMGTDFIRAWCRYEYKLTGLITNMTRTKDVKLCGGFPDFCRGNHSDNALVVKLCLNNYVAFNQRCTFRYRIYELSEGLSVSYQELIKATKQFFDFLDSDPRILNFAREQPELWSQSRRYLIKMTWQTCYSRWKGIYRKRLGVLQWITVACTMPFILDYYIKIFSTLMHIIIGYMKRKRNAFC